MFSEIGKIVVSVPGLRMIADFIEKACPAGSDDKEFEVNCSLYTYDDADGTSRKTLNFDLPAPLTKAMHNHEEDIEGGWRGTENEIKLFLKNNNMSEQQLLDILTFNKDLIKMISRGDILCKKQKSKT